MDEEEYTEVEETAELLAAMVSNEVTDTEELPDQTAEADMDEEVE